MRVALPLLYAAEAVAFAILALLVDDFVLVAVLALATLDGSLASAARALTRAAAAAALAPAGQLREGNALLNIAFTVGAAGGPAIAGVVVAGAGIETALLADAVSFLAVAVVLAVARAAASRRARAANRLGRAPAPRARVRARPGRAAAPARRPGARLHLLRARDPDRGRVREGDPRRRRRRLRRPARELGRRHGRRQPRSSPRLRKVPLPRPAAASRPWRSASPTSPPPSPPRSPSPARPRSIGGLGNGVQWIALVTAVQELTRAELPGPRAGAARGAGERDARRRLPARRRDRDDLRAADELRGRGRRRARGARRSPPRLLRRTAWAPGARAGRVGQRCKFRCRSRTPRARCSPGR